METEKFKFELKPFRVDSFRNFLMFGYPIVGGWLPRVGFKTDYEYEDVFDITSKTVIKYFIAEWFLRGYLLVYKVETEIMLGENGND